MKINIVEFEEGARLAQGVTVVIDVFRAFSVACYASDAGASGLIVTGSVEEACSLKKRYRNALLAGERDERKPEGFDIGNSPTEVLTAGVKGKTFIHTTTAGTRGLLSVSKAQIVLTGSIVNAGAVAKHIERLNPEILTLVAMGYRGCDSAEEDLLCAGIIADRVKGGRTDFSEKISALKETSGRRFFNPQNIGFSPPSDFFLCTMANRFNFVLQAIRRYDGNIDLMRIDL
jgi:2-phosphosulfolactate phosphatase